MILLGQINECEECGKRWLSEGEVLPKRCSRCKSSKWNASGRVENPAPDVERLLRSARPSLAPIPESDPEREAEAIRARASRKAARAERKAELAEAITSALPVQVQPEAKSAAVARPHNFHSGVSPVAGCDVCAAAAEAYKGTG